MDNGASGIIDIHHVAMLAKLDLSGEELKRFEAELDKILGYIGMLGEADVSIISGIEEELEYDRLATGIDLNADFYEDCRIDVCKTDDSFDFSIVKSNAPEFEAASADSESGFFVVPQVIE